jgi:hypothetical protein
MFCTLSYTPPASTGTYDSAAARGSRYQNTCEHLPQHEGDLRLLALKNDWVDTRMACWTRIGIQDGRGGASWRGGRGEGGVGRGKEEEEEEEEERSRRRRRGVGGGGGGGGGTSHGKMSSWLLPSP